MDGWAASLIVGTIMSAVAESMVERLYREIYLWHNDTGAREIFAIYSSFDYSTKSNFDEKEYLYLTEASSNGQEL